MWPTQYLQRSRITRELASRKRRVVRLEQVIWKNFFWKSLNGCKYFGKSLKDSRPKPNWKSKISRYEESLIKLNHGHKVYRKNYVCLKPNFNYNISANQNTLCTLLPATTPTATAQRIAPRSQSALMEQQQTLPPTSDPVVIDLTADSSS